MSAAQSSNSGLAPPPPAASPPPHARQGFDICTTISKPARPASRYILRLALIRPAPDTGSRAVLFRYSDAAGRCHVAPAPPSSHESATALHRSWGWSVPWDSYATSALAVLTRMKRAFTAAQFPGFLFEPCPCAGGAWLGEGKHRHAGKLRGACVTSSCPGHRWRAQ